MGLNIQQMKEQVAYQNYRNQTILNPYTGQQGANASSYAYIDGQKIRLNELTDEQWEQLMGPEEVEEEEDYSSTESSSRLANSIESYKESSLGKEDEEFFAYMTYMENWDARIENYT